MIISFKFWQTNSLHEGITQSISSLKVANSKSKKFYKILQWKEYNNVNTGILTH